MHCIYFGSDRYNDETRVHFDMNAEMIWLHVKGEAEMMIWM